MLQCMPGRRSLLVVVLLSVLIAANERSSSCSPAARLKQQRPVSLGTIYGQAWPSVYANVSLRPNDVHGWGIDHLLYKKMVSVMAPKVVVEVGVWKGATTISFAEQLKRQGNGGTVIAVDTWLGAVEFWTRFINTPERDLQFVNGYPSVYYTFLSNVLRHEVQDFVVPLPSPSTMAAQILTTKGIRADIIHVDGSHEYADVKSDLYTWWKLVADDGVLFGDDYTRHWPGLRRAVDEFTNETGARMHTRGGKWLIPKCGTLPKGI